MRPQKTRSVVQILLLFVGFVLICLIYLALTDIVHGQEPDLTNEWDIVQIGIKIVGGVILMSIILSALNLFRKR